MPSPESWVITSCPPDSRLQLRVWSKSPLVEYRQDSRIAQTVDMLFYEYYNKAEVNLSTSRADIWMGPNTSYITR